MDEEEQITALKEFVPKKVQAPTGCSSLNVHLGLDLKTNEGQ